MEDQKQTIREWAQAHKKQIAVGITITVAGVALIIGTKNAKKIEEALSTLPKALEKLEETLNSLPKSFEKAPLNVTEKVTPQVTRSQQVITKQSVSISESAVTFAAEIVRDETTQMQDIHVPDFYRRLPKNYNPSLAKLEQAKKLNIEIPDGYTLVDSYDYSRRIA